jgi:hypothetical protein
MSHEPQNLASRTLIVAGSVLAAFAFLVLAVCMLLDRQWIVPDANVAHYPARPRLQVTPSNDLDTFRKEQRNTEIWGWVDADHRVARIPVARAMQLMAKENKQ